MITPFVLNVNSDLSLGIIDAYHAKCFPKIYFPVNQDRLLSYCCLEVPPRLIWTP